MKLAAGGVIDPEEERSDAKRPGRQPHKRSMARPIGALPAH